MRYLILILLTIITLSFYLLKYQIFSINPYINQFLSQFCPDQAIYDPKNYPWSQAFRDHYQVILNEFNGYHNQIPYHRELNDQITWCDIHHKWKTLYLRVFNHDTLNARYFAETMKLINNSPCTLAYFSILEPGAKLSPHYGIYKGVLRYHLGLIIPDHYQDCFIVVNNTKLYWQAGEDLMFDDCYLHHVENNTNQPRVILFLDIQRDFDNVIINWINRLLLYMIKSNDSLQETLQQINIRSSNDKIDDTSQSVE